MALPTTQVRLAELRNAADKAESAQYARYSGFDVVAAVERTDGKIYGGANIEVVNFTLTKHAEEIAAIAAIADGALELHESNKWLSTVYTRGWPPCGSCRQFLWEWATEDTICVIDRPKYEYPDPTHEVLLADLIPFPFDPSMLPDRRVPRGNS